MEITMLEHSNLSAFFSEKVRPSRKHPGIIPSAVRLERIEDGTFIKMERDHMWPSEEQEAGKQENPMW
jgi:hypothetical protein